MIKQTACSLLAVFLITIVGSAQSSAKRSSSLFHAKALLIIRQAKFNNNLLQRRGVAGTVWKDLGENPSYTLEFKAGGRLIERHEDADMASEGRWKQRGSKIYFFMEETPFHDRFRAVGAIAGSKLETVFTFFHASSNSPRRVTIVFQKVR